MQCLRVHSTVSLRWRRVSTNDHVLIFFPNSSRKLMSVADYPFLAELGLKDHNDGVYYGKWTGNGPTVQSIDPSTGKVIASVREVRSQTPLHVLSQVSFSLASPLIILPRVQWRTIMLLWLPPRRLPKSGPRCGSLACVVSSSGNVLPGRSGRLMAVAGDCTQAW